MGNPFVDSSGRFRTPTEDEARAYFWSLVNRGEPAECWEWSKGLSTRGYGQFRVRGLAFSSGLAHRWAFYFEHGVAPREVSHLCNNMKCCNPAHLADGTHLDNERHKDRSGRRPRGVKNLPCPKCGGEQFGRGRRGTPGVDGKPREFAFCIPCRKQYLAEYHRRRKVAAGVRF